MTSMLGTEHKLRRFAGVTLSAAKWRACSRNPGRSRGIEKLRYIHRNPVGRRLVDSPEQWRWSSFRFYLYGEPEPVRVNDTDALVIRIRGHAA